MIKKKTLKNLCFHVILELHCLGISESDQFYLKWNKKQVYKVYEIT